MESETDEWDNGEKGPHGHHQRNYDWIMSPWRTKTILHRFRSAGIRHVEASSEFGDTVCYVYDLAPIFKR